MRTIRLLIAGVITAAACLLQASDEPLPPPLRSDAAEWSPMNALVLAEAAALAYEDDNGEAVKAALRCETYDRLHFPVTLPKKFKFEEGEPGPQAFVAAGEAHIVIAFRGTEINVVDLLTDACAVPVSLSDKIPGKVHGGFATTFLSVWAELSARLAEARKKFPNAKIWITGHSLGGGLAVMTAAKLALEEKIPVQGVITFGAPVTGDREFHEKLSAALGPRQWRCIHQLDFVALDIASLKILDFPGSSFIPEYAATKKALTYFCHGGEAFYLNADGTFAANASGAWKKEAVSLVKHWVKSRSFSAPADGLGRHSIRKGYVPALRKHVAAKYVAGEAEKSE